MKLRVSWLLVMLFAAAACSGSSNADSTTTEQVIASPLPIGTSTELPEPEPTDLPQPLADTGTTAIVDVRLFDGQNVTEQTTVVFSGSQILAVGPDIAVPAGATVIDGSGRTLFPGLIDAHTHTTFDGALVRAASFGVTTHLDMFSEPQFLEAERVAEASNPDRPQADIVSAGILGTAPGGHGTQFGLEIETMSTPEDAATWVQAQADSGADFIKLVLEDGSLFNSGIPTLDTPTFAAAVAEAERLELLTVTHVSTLEDATRAIENGSTGLAHLFVDQPATAEFVQLIDTRQGFVVPTLVVLSSASNAPSGASVIDDEHLGPRLTALERDNLGFRFPFGDVDLADPLQSVTALFAAGVPVLAGSDAPNPGTTFGASLHREIEYFVEAGMATTDALASATSIPADVFGLSDRGRIESGLLADLVLVEGNPIADITATRAIVSVWKSGLEVDLDAEVE